MNKRGPSAGRGENFGVNNFSNEWVFFSFLRVFIFIFFSPTAVVARFLMKMDGVFFFSRPPIKEC